MEKKKTDFNKIIMITLIVLGVIVAAYILQAAYFRHTGAIITENASYVTEDDTVSVQGISLRDEARISNSVNTAILKKNAGGIYQPIVNDGENVAKGDYIAYRFSSEEQATAYRKIQEIDAKIEYLSRFRRMGNTSNSDISALNADISLSISKYLDAIDSNDFTNCDELLANVNYSLISRQAATGETSDFSKKIQAYTQERTVLSNQVGKKSGVSAPFAGYFVSTVDGFEESYDYEKLSSDGITVKQINKLLNKEAETSDDVFGKIVGQYVWYFAFNIPISKASNLSTGSTFTVSFPEHGLENIEMMVAGSSKSENTLAVLLKCKNITKDILRLRKENAVLTLNRYSGFKISNEAITDDGNGNIGVYVYAGQIAVFKPIDIVYRCDDYVLANAVTDENDITGVNDSKVLKEYDRIILKGRNLYDGKVLG